MAPAVQHAAPALALRHADVMVIAVQPVLAPTETPSRAPSVCESRDASVVSLGTGNPRSWTAWTVTALCSSQCGVGTQPRSRTCTNGDCGDCGGAAGASDTVRCAVGLWSSVASHSPYALTDRDAAQLVGVGQLRSVQQPVWVWHVHSDPHVRQRGLWTVRWQ